MTTVSGGNDGQLIIKATETDTPFASFVVAASNGETQVTVTVGINSGSFGSFTDPNQSTDGSKSSNGGTSITLSGPIPQVSTDLESIIYHPSPMFAPDGTSRVDTVTASVVGTQSSASATIKEVTKGVIMGAGTQTAPAEVAIQPFHSITITDGSSDYEDFQIIEQVNGTTTDAGTFTGMVAGTGLNKTASGVYSLPHASFSYPPPSVPFDNRNLQSLTFTPSAQAAGQHITFMLTMTNSQGLVTTNNDTEVDVSGQPSPPKGVLTIASLTTATVVQQNQATAIAGISISDTSATTGETFTVIMSDANGVLTTTGTDGTITPSNGGTTLTIAGSLEQVNSDLAALSDNDPTASPDTISVKANDSTGDTAQAVMIGVTVTSGQQGPDEPLPNPPFPPPDTPPNFNIIDMSTGQSGTSAGQPYNGPVGGIDWQLIDITRDKLDITSNVPNTFIHSGSGDDALSVSGPGGNNILDGSTGSNFLTGGAGNDTFYVDDRDASAPTWSTVVNLHSGDTATIWTPPEFEITTLSPDDFKMPHFVTPHGLNLLTSDGNGAPGFTGLTIGITAPGKPDANLTLKGYSTADLTSGRLTISFGHTGDLPGLPGSDYMMIHAT